MKLYVAGPMRGIQHFNFPAFEAAAAALRRLGHEVFSPAERDIRLHGGAFSESNLDGDNAKAEREHGFSLRDALADDLDWICRHADGIALLEGWEGSKGASAEIAAAHALGISVFPLHDLLAIDQEQSS